MNRNNPLKRVEVWRSGTGKWYWRCVSANGRIKADGGQGYSTKNAAVKGVMSTVLPPYRLISLNYGSAYDVLGVVAAVDFIDSSATYCEVDVILDDSEAAKR
jgi:uncharacterized protein YegP (UPF0339 family)